ncbi:MAG: double-strand break repair protein AddB, partial [Alphaproteobacteria bacterium]|nr:double-strand break repair protein AddB [Alphaproteobacteria bacterium]
MSPPRVFSIPAGAAFVDLLAAGLLRRAAGENPLALAAMTVLLPTRRACRALREAFLAQADGRPLLLPTMRPLGEVEEDALGLDDPAGAGDESEDGIPPAIDPLTRRVLLARLVLARPDARRTPAQAVELATALADLLDRAQTEGRGLAALPELVPAEFARHWQITLEFLGLITRHWPRILAERGAIDPAERRNRVLRRYAARLLADPPQAPVIAAGSTGSIPATAELLAAIARLPQGAVILPGLDRDLDDDSWRALEPSHPQWGLKRLLGRLELDRDAVADWEEAASGPRAALLSAAMRPAETTAAWRSLAPQAGALDGLGLIEADSQEAEAGAIALAMRETLERPGRSCALVTPDRELARRVAAALGRWGVNVDDSAGQPLARTPPGAFFRLVAELASDPAAPVALLAVSKHPLAGGADPAPFRAMARTVERAALRGPRPAKTLDDLGALLEPEARAWLGGIVAALGPLTEELG